MAKMVNGEVSGTISTPLFGQVTVQPREGATVLKSLSNPQHLKGVKGMTNDELNEWAAKHGMTQSDAKAIRSNQRALKDAIETCNDEQEENPKEFKETYVPKGPLASTFNACVSDKLSAS